jgi:hypothetical protein
MPPRAGEAPSANPGAQDAQNDNGARAFDQPGEENAGPDHIGHNRQLTSKRRRRPSGGHGR